MAATPADIIRAFNELLNVTLDIIQKLLVSAAEDDTALATAKAQFQTLEDRLRSTTTQLDSTQMEQSELDQILAGFRQRIDSLAPQVQAATAVSTTTSTTLGR